MQRLCHHVLYDFSCSVVLPSPPVKVRAVPGEFVVVETPTEQKKRHEGK